MIYDVFQEFQLSDWTDTSISPMYMGYINKGGNWIIKRIDYNSMTVRYAFGLDNYVENWNNRGALEYSYYSSVF